MPTDTGTVNAAESELTKIKADLAAVKAKVEAFDSKATSYVAAHAHAVVTALLVVAVLYIMHKIL
jgi:predicted neutral ceramidase superfamily lipid hydrolase